NSQADLLVRIDNKQRAHGQCVAGIGMDQIVEIGHLAVGIGQNREIHLGILGFVDIVDPLQVRVHRVYGQGNGFDVALGKFILELGGKAQLRGADWSEVSGMGEQNSPAVTQPLVETNATCAGFLFEVGGDVAKLEAHVSQLLVKNPTRAK